MAQVFTKITRVPGDLHKLKPARSSPDTAYFEVHQDDGSALLGETPSLKLVMQEPQQLFHEAAVFQPSTDKDRLWVTSKPIGTGDGRRIVVSALIRNNPGELWRRTELGEDATPPMCNGAVNYPAAGPDAVLYCAQGTKTDVGGMAVVHSRGEKPHIEWLTTSFHGRWFNSVNDVIVARDGAVWFTDPTYGYEQDFRPKPQLPSQLYRLDVKNNSLRAVADGLGHPNGLCFDPLEQTLYATDTHWMYGTGETNDTRESNIYAFDITYRHGSPFLTNRRLFATCDAGIPDGIKCDTRGNVYSGCGDGVQVWAPTGDLILKICVPGGVANFCFGRPGELLVLNESRFWEVKLAPGVRGALLEGLGIVV